MSITWRVFESNIPPAKEVNGPTPTSSGSEMWISREWTVDFDISKPRVIFKSKSPADTCSVNTLSMC